MLKAVFFDLDGTLLYMDEPKFLEIYFREMKRWMADHGKDADKFIEGTIAGTRAMLKNDGSVTNEVTFWQNLEGVWGKASGEDKALMDSYYESAFDATFAACKPNPYSKDIVRFCREAGLIVVLSTNPLFPKVATTKRMAISDLYESDFDLVTAYENSGFCKPNPAYFTDLLERFNLKEDEVIVFGNNTFDDGECAIGAGLKCYIIESENLIESEKTTHEFDRIKITDVIPTINKHIKSL